MSDTINTIVQGNVGIGITLSFLSDATGATAVPIHSILDVSPPAQQVDAVKYTPVGGTGGGVEKVVPGKHPSTDSTVKCVYAKSLHSVLEAILGVKGTFTWTYNDGSTTVGHGFLSKIQVDPINDTALETSSLTFSLDGGSVYAASNP